MGRTSKERPRRGSLQFWPRKRAKRIYPRINNAAKKKQATLLGFAGYKAGMTHIIGVDNAPKSITKGEEISIPVTILETPNIKIAGLRLYSSDFYGLHSISDIWSDTLDKELNRIYVFHPPILTKTGFEFKILRYLELCPTL